jgi:hypothetical protein
MYATAHWDLVEFTTQERLAGARRPAVAAAAPVTPGKVTRWGPRASRRVERLAQVLRIPEPREFADARTEDAVLLDA